MREEMRIFGKRYYDIISNLFSTSDFLPDNSLSVALATS